MLSDYRGIIFLQGGKRGADMVATDLMLLVHHRQNVGICVKIFEQNVLLLGMMELVGIISDEVNRLGDRFAVLINTLVRGGKDGDIGNDVPTGRDAIRGVPIFSSTPAAKGQRF